MLSAFGDRKKAIINTDDDEMKLTKFPSQAKLNTLGLNKKILYQHFKHGFKGGFGSDNIARDGIVKSIMNYSELEGELGAESLMMNDSPPIT